MITAKRHASSTSTFEIKAWTYMRLSAILLVPLVWIHTLINTLIIGAENISLDFVAMRWASIGWRVYDILLLTFAFSHGVSGLRQVLIDFTSNSMSRKALNLVMLFFWLVLSIIGAAGIIGGIER
jgi:succinate dehydrogenase / fumarate reductase membrane anchor subunit